MLRYSLKLYLRNNILESVKFSHFIVFWKINPKESDKEIVKKLLILAKDSSLIRNRFEGSL